MGTDKKEGENPTAAELAVDYWKLLKVCERMMKSLPEDRRKRAGAQVRFSASRLKNHLDALGIELLTFEGLQFGPELPAIAVNADDFGNAENLLVESAIEPAVIMHGKVVENAQVTLKEGEINESGN
jgi:hypothetical protein